MRIVHKALDFEKFSILEASTLAKAHLPKEMIKAIHQKEEHRSQKYKNLGKVHQAQREVTLEYEYYRPTHDIEIGEPITFTGRLVPPPVGSARTSQYPDMAQFLQDIPSGPIGVLLTRPQDEVYLYLYHKTKWGGGPERSKKANAEGASGGGQGGQQYAVIVWDREAKEAVDYGFHALTTDGVEKSLVRKVHEVKGGNTNQKVQEYILNTGNGAPKRDRPVYGYVLKIGGEARKKRTERSTDDLSMDLIRVFSARMERLIDRMKPKTKEKFVDNIKETGALWGMGISPEEKALADKLGVSEKALMNFLFTKMKDFRKQMFTSGVGAYDKESGFNLEKEKGTFAGSNGDYTMKYDFDPEDKRPEIKPRTNSNTPLKRKLPQPGEYASIKSMIKKHTVDGVLNKYFAFLVTGKLLDPDADLMGLLGVGDDFFGANSVF